MFSQLKPIVPLALVSTVMLAAGNGFEARSRQAQGSDYFSGSDLFKTYCAVCHGSSAKGDGPLADKMKKRPPDLTLFAVKNGGTYPAALVARIIDGRNPMPGHGGPDMPVWADAFKASRNGLSEEAVKARIDAIVRHLETLQQKTAKHRDLAEGALAQR